MAGRAPELLEVIDRRGLMDLGFSERSVDAILRQVPVLTLPGTRRIYMRCRDVAACIDRYLYDETTAFGEVGESGPIARSTGEPRWRTSPPPCRHPPL